VRRLEQVERKLAGSRKREGEKPWKSESPRS
jgi:hypothetical protein